MITFKELFRAQNHKFKNASYIPWTYQMFEAYVSEAEAINADSSFVKEGKKILHKYPRQVKSIPWTAKLISTLYDIVDSDSELGILLNAAITKNKRTPKLAHIPWNNKALVIAVKQGFGPSLPPPDIFKIVPGTFKFRYAGTGGYYSIDNGNLISFSSTELVTNQIPGTILNGIFKIYPDKAPTRIELIGSTSIKEVVALNTSSVTNMYDLFNGCSNLETIYAFNVSNVTDVAFMFKNCSKLTTIPSLQFQNITRIVGMFSNCSSLINIPLFDTSSVTIGPLSGFVDNCTSLVALPAFDFSRFSDYFGTFTNCPLLADIDITGIVATVDFSGTGINGTEIDDIFTILPSVVLGQLILLPLAAIGYTISIATNKGWTVISE